MQDDEIRTLLMRLARPHASGGQVIERAAVLAEGADFESVMSWILAHEGEAEAPTDGASKGGLYGSRLGQRGATPAPKAPARFVLPSGVLT